MMIFTLLILSSHIHAGIVRDLHMNDSKSESIALCLGRSTVLRFKEKPIKIVVGNKNHFNLEFIANDITIQPLNSIGSNLFVYGKYNQYAFNLVFHQGQCDDLVKIFGHAKAGIRKKAQFTLSNAIKISLSSLVRAAIGQNIEMVEMTIFNLGSKIISTKNLKININQLVWQWVWEKDTLMPGEKMRGRIILKMDKNPLSATFELNGKSHHMVFPAANP